MLLGQMLRELQSSMFSESEEEDTGIGAGPLVDALFTELAVSLSRAGGLGIGAAMAEPLARQADMALEGARSGLLSTAAFSTAGRGATAPTFEIPWAPSPAARAALEGRVTSAYGWREDPIDATPRFHLRES